MIKKHIKSILFVILLTLVCFLKYTFAQELFTNIEEAKEKTLVEHVIIQENSMQVEQKPVAIEKNTVLNDNSAEVVKDEKASFFQNIVFDDRMLLNGYTKKFVNETKHILIAMIKDDTLSPYKSAAAIRVFKTKYSEEIVSREKRIMEKMLIRRFVRTTSPFVQIEIMHTLCLMDRYRYFKAMIPSLIQKLDHYNATVNELAAEYLDDIVEERGNKRSREARIVFTTLRKVLFLSRKRLQDVKEPSPPLKEKLKLLRWAVKILGNQELKRLPSEVIPLL